MVLPDEVMDKSNIFHRRIWLQIFLNLLVSKKEFGTDDVAIALLVTLQFAMQLK